MTLGTVAVVELLSIRCRLGAGVQCPTRRDAAQQHRKAQRPAQPGGQFFLVEPCLSYPSHSPLSCVERKRLLCLDRKGQQRVARHAAPIAVAGIHIQHAVDNRRAGPVERASFGLGPHSCFRIPGRRYTPRPQRRLRLSRHANDRQQNRKRPRRGSRIWPRTAPGCTGRVRYSLGAGYAIYARPSPHHRQTSRRRHSRRGWSSSPGLYLCGSRYRCRTGPHRWSGHRPPAPTGCPRSDRPCPIAAAREFHRPGPGLRREGRRISVRPGGRACRWAA